MKTVVGLSLLAGASAFVPAAPFVPSASIAGRTRGDVSMAAVEKSKSIPFLPRPANLDGTIPGDVGFDPVGFTNWLPVPYLQEAEIKHGRIAMLATAGWIFADFVKLPGEVHQVSSLAAHDVAVKSGALHQILIWTSIAEAVSLIAITQMLGGSGRKPGEFKFDPLNLAKDEKSFKDLQLKEIKNGRLAMLAFSGIVTQAALYNSPFPYI